MDKKFKEINFGQSITHETFDSFVPKRLDKKRDAAEYRKWKLR